MPYTEITPEQMTPDQLHCYQMLCDWRGGAHHLGRITRFGHGIRTTVYSCYLATYDLGALTTLVLLAHDRCVRVELGNGGPSRTAICCHRRHARRSPTGPTWDQHPTIEQTIEIHRRSWPAPEAAGPPR